MGADIALPSALDMTKDEPARGLYFRWVCSWLDSAPTSDEQQLITTFYYREVAVIDAARSIRIIRRAAAHGDALVAAMDPTTTTPLEVIDKEFA